MALYDLKRREPVHYSAELGEWIAERVAEGASLLDLRDAYPDRMPTPLQCRRWRDTWPGFDTAMRDAERARAEWLAEDSVRVSDAPGDAARCKVRADARRWMAERLDRDRYGQRVDHHHSGQVDVVHELSDAQLAAIATGGGGRVVDGEARRVEHAEADPAQLTPPTTQTPGLEPARASGAKGFPSPRSSAQKNFDDNEAAARPRPRVVDDVGPV